MCANYREHKIRNVINKKQNRSVRPGPADIKCEILKDDRRTQKLKNH
jgi:hypothetical protein